MKMYYPLRSLLEHSSHFTHIPTKKEEKWRFSLLDNYLGKEYKKTSLIKKEIFCEPEEAYWICIKDGQIVDSDIPPSLHMKLHGDSIELNCFEDIELSIYFDHSPHTFIGSNLNMILQKGVQAKLYLKYEGGEKSFISHSSNIKLEPCAHLTQTQVQDLSPEAAFILQNRLYLHENSCFKNFSLLKEGEYIHNLLQADLHYHSTFDITSLLLSHQRQRSIFSCDINHLADSSTSRVLSKQVIKDNSVCVFDALTQIAKLTKSNQAKQASHALLLSESAQIHSKPHLEIYSDDLSASHGSTVGELDKEAISYLLSRGIQEEKARAILISAFINETIENVDVSAYKEKVLKILGEDDE